MTRPDSWFSPFGHRFGRNRHSARKPALGLAWVGMESAISSLSRWGEQMPQTRRSRGAHGPRMFKTVRFRTASDILLKMRGDFSQQEVKSSTNFWNFGWNAIE